MGHRLLNRLEAGQQLAQKLQPLCRGLTGLVLALPRGGVPVAYPIASSLQWPLDVCLVRKLGAPTQPELAMGAIASDGVRVINQDIVSLLRVSPAEIDYVSQKEEQELKRRDELYRPGLSALALRDRVIVLVDDGIATGSTIKAAIAIIKKQHPQTLIIAVPVIAPDISRQLQAEVDHLIYLLQPPQLQSIGLWYEDFSQVPDQVVCEYLAQARGEMSSVKKQEN